MASNQAELLPHVVNKNRVCLLISLVFISLNFVSIWAQFVCIITMAFNTYVTIAIVFIFMIVLLLSIVMVLLSLSSNAC